MGFCDLHSFNLAMLGKQIWRVIYYLHSLLSRILKVKYFPNNDILDAVPKVMLLLRGKAFVVHWTLLGRGIIREWEME